MGSALSKSQFNTIVMTSLPESYRPTLQTITAAERTNLALGTSSKTMKGDDLISFLIEEAQHRVIIKERARVAESALAAHTRGRSGRRKLKEVSESESEDTCKNCERLGHTKSDCWSKGGGKEGQGPKQKRKDKAKESESAIIAASEDNNELFVFTCTSDHTNLPKTSKSGQRACVNSLVNQHYCPEHSKFRNYRLIKGTDITTVDGQQLKAVGIGNIYIQLPNGSGHTKSLLRNMIHAPDMAFTLISVSKLDEAKCSVSFNKGICTIKNPTGVMMAKILRADGLYQIPILEKQSVNPKQNIVDNGSDKITNPNIVTITGDVLAEGERGKVTQTPANINEPRDSDVLPKERKSSDESHLESTNKDGDQLKGRQSCQPWKHDDTYILKSQMHSHSCCFESQRSSSGKLSTNLFSNEYQSSAEKTKGIKSDVPLSQMDTSTIPEKIPATVVPPEISCRSHLRDGHLVVIDEASQILKFRQLRSPLDKIG